jgi:hypothetical protein
MRRAWQWQHDSRKQRRVKNVVTIVPAQPGWKAVYDVEDAPQPFIEEVVAWAVHYCFRNDKGHWGSVITPEPVVLGRGFSDDPIGYVMPDGRFYQQWFTRHGRDSAPAIFESLAVFRRAQLKAANSKEA